MRPGLAGQIALACAISIFNLNASASTQGAASLTDIQITVTDLDPLDGQTARFDLVDGASSTYLRTFTGVLGSGNGAITDTWQSDGLFQTHDLTVSNAYAMATANSDEHVLSAEGAVLSDGGIFNASAQSPRTFLGSFLLAPHTSVVLTGNASVSVSIGERLLSPLVGYDEASAVAGLDFMNISGGELKRATNSINTYQRFDDTHAAYEGSQSKALRVELANTSDVAVTGQFLAYADASGMTATSPVPEPGRGALLLCGISIALLSRRLAKQ